MSLYHVKESEGFKLEMCHDVRLRRSVAGINRPEIQDIDYLHVDHASHYSLYHNVLGLENYAGYVNFI